MKLISGYRIYLMFAITLISLFALLAIPATANPGLTVDNALILADVRPGQTLTQTMKLKIASIDPAADISIRVTGVAQSLQGAFELLDAAHDTGPYSARDFVTVDKSSIHLEPGNSVDLTATVHIPQNVEAGGKYAIINIATLPPPGSGLSFITAVDIPVYLTLDGSKLIHTGKVTGISIGNFTSGKPINILTNFQNTGNHHFKVKGQITIKNDRGQTIGDIPIPLTSSSILPGMTRQLTGTLKPVDALPIGTYAVDSKVTLDDGTLLDESTGNFEVKPESIPVASSAAPAQTNAVPKGAAQYTPMDIMATTDLMPSSSSILKNADETISINFPLGAAVTPVKISLLNMPADQVPALPSEITLASTWFKVDGLTGLLAKEAAVTVKYKTGDLEQANGDPSKLKLARWNEGTNQWTIYKTSNDTAAKALTTNSNQMGIWAVVVGPADSPALNWTIIFITVAVLAMLITVFVFYTLRKRRG
jgi:hypothetical protein